MLAVQCLQHVLCALSSVQHCVSGSQCFCLGRCLDGVLLVCRLCSDCSVCLITITIIITLSSFCCQGVLGVLSSDKGAQQ